MAKRKRLDPDPAPGPVAPAPGAAALPALAGPPIARVAGDAAREAALSEMTAAWQQARDDGRLLQRLPLERIVADHLIRDRLADAEAEMAPLLDSLRARGQQTPIEVVALEGGDYGLISGWRRLRALRRLQAETGDPRFATVLALLRRPKDAAEAYVAMVEENEIRLGLSYYERGRIVLRAVEGGVFPDRETALRSLFAAGSRARRSKIGSFAGLVAALDGALRFPAAIGERLGLRLSREIAARPGFGPDLVRRLVAAAPQTPEAEQRLLEQALKVGPAPVPQADEAALAVPPGPVAGVRVAVSGSARAPVLRLSGPGVDAGFTARLVAWLAAQDG